jgi:hypothetical protein
LTSSSQGPTCGPFEESVSFKAATVKICELCSRENRVQFIKDVSISSG